VWEFKTPQESLDTISRTAQLRMVRSLFALVSAGYFNEFREICLSHPYVHRPLLEFCLGVPISQFLYQGQTRSLMRRALRDLLPTKVLNRKSKGMLDEAFVRALRREWSNIGNLDRWQLCERGFADGDMLRDSLERLRLGLPAQGASAIRIFSLERWLRSLGTVSNAQKPNDSLPTELMIVTSHSMSAGQFVRGATLL
jgi:Asparagine synthase